MILIIVAFLFEWRTAFISLIAIPLSLLAAMLVLDLRGATINVMVLAGLVVAIGVVVDDAIIDVENIVRRLRQARAGGQRRIDLQDRARRLASRCARRSPTRPLINIVAVVPVLFLEGLSGSFFQPLVLSYGAGGAGVDAGRADGHAGAVPADAVARASCRHRESPLLRVLKRGYGALLARVIRTAEPGDR